MHARTEVRSHVLLYIIGCIFAASFFGTSVQAYSAVTTELPAISGAATADFALKDGDRVLFYGDSITEQRLYTSYVEHYVLTHYPDRRITFLNTGWGGDSVTHNGCEMCAGVGGLARLERDVIAHKPTVVTLLFGMNDGNYADFDPAIMKVFEDGLAEIIHQIKARTSARIYVMTPTVYDGTRHTPWSHTDRYNEVLERYGKAAMELANREKLAVIDLHSVTTAALHDAKSIESSYTFLPDGVHPEPDGQLVIAAGILKAWGALEKGLEINVQPKLDSHGASSFSINAPLQWPAPLPSATLSRAAPQITGLGGIVIKFKGLPSAPFSLMVDGKELGVFNGNQLESGLDLNALPGIDRTSTTKLQALIRQRADLFFMRWRQLEVPFSGTYVHTTSTVSAMDQLIDDLLERERKLAKPVAYQLSISPVSKME
jgi:lysophospholipase L1-like esterase